MTRVFIFFLILFNLAVGQEVLIVDDNNSPARAREKEERDRSNTHTNCSLFFEPRARVHAFERSCDHQLLIVEDNNSSSRAGGYKGRTK